MKSIIRELTPPILWRTMGRLLAPRNNHTQVETGAERSSEWYDAIYETAHVYRSHYADSPYYALWCVIVDRIAPPTVNCVFDLGCGPGQFAALLRDRGLKKYVGLDFSEASIRLAKPTCGSFEFVCADAFKTDLFKTLKYDVLVATEFLEHVNDDLVIIDYIRPGTKVYASVPNFPHAGHVRHFRSTAEVSARYGDRFKNFRVDEILNGSKGGAFFLFEGIRDGKMT